MSQGVGQYVIRHICLKWLWGCECSVCLGCVVNLEKSETFGVHSIFIIKKNQQWDYVVIEINLSTLGRTKTSQIYGHFKCCMVRNVAYLFFSLVHIISCNEDQIFPTHLLMEITI